MFYNKYSEHILLYQAPWNAASASRIKDFWASGHRSAWSAAPCRSISQRARSTSYRCHRRPGHPRGDVGCLRGHNDEMLVELKRGLNENMSLCSVSHYTFCCSGPWFCGDNQLRDAEIHSVDGHRPAPYNDVYNHPTKTAIERKDRLAVVVRVSVLSYTVVWCRQVT